MPRGDIVRYVVETECQGDVGKAAALTGFTQQQINSWIQGTTQPQADSMGAFLYNVFAPEFHVIAEYVPIDTSASEVVRSQLAKIFQGHEKASGLYAFYDSMANLIYIGKSDGDLRGECSRQLEASIGEGYFPKGAKSPKKRIDVVRYVSAYYVKTTEYDDFAKHIEALILRISKPILNSNIGELPRVDRHTSQR